VILVTPERWYMLFWLGCGAIWLGVNLLMLRELRRLRR